MDKELTMPARNLLAAAIVAAFAFGTAPAMAEDSAANARVHVVPGEKLDSGLGDLPHYRDWPASMKAPAPAVVGRINPVPGEKLDSGLGDLPPYRGPAPAPVAVNTIRK